jgi:hypothetical protein
MDFSSAERSAGVKDGRDGRPILNSLRVFTVSVLMLFVVGCSGGESKIPSLDESTDVLAKIYSVRHMGTDLCEYGSSFGNCRALLEDAGKAPESMPAIVCDAEYLGGGTSAPGRLLRIETPVSGGYSVTTEVLALKDGGRVTFMNPVYWLPSSVSVSNETGTPLEFSCHE